MRIAQLTRAPVYSGLIKPGRLRWYFRRDTTETNDETNRGIVERPVVLTTTEAYTLLRISRQKLYDLINSRQLDTIKIGKRRLVPMAAISALIERLRGEANI